MINARKRTANGVCSSSTFGNIQGAAYAPSRSALYVMDSCALRAISNLTSLSATASSLSSAVIAGVAGTCALTDGFGTFARFSAPANLMYDAVSDSLFLFDSDANSKKWRRVNLATAEVSLAQGMGNSFSFSVGEIGDVAGVPTVFSVSSLTQVAAGQLTAGALGAVGAIAGKSSAGCSDSTTNKQSVSFTSIRAVSWHSPSQRLFALDAGCTNIRKVSYDGFSTLWLTDAAKLSAANTYSMEIDPSTGLLWIASYASGGASALYYANAVSGTSLTQLISTNPSTTTDGIALSGVTVGLNQPGFLTTVDGGSIVFVEKAGNRVRAARGVQRPDPPAIAASGTPTVITVTLTANTGNLVSTGCTMYVTDSLGTTSTLSLAAGVYSGSVTGLTRNTAYYLNATCSNAVGTSDSSGTVNYTTPADVPTAPTPLAASSVTSTGAVVTWGSPADSGGVALAGYAVFLGGAQVAALGAGATSYTMTGLAASTSYTRCHTDAQSQPVAEPQPEPVAQCKPFPEPEPVADGDAEPQPEPCAKRLSIAQPVADGDAEPEPEPCARRLSIAQPVADGDAEPEPEPCARRLSIAQPVADGDAEPQPEPCARRLSIAQPVADGDAEPQPEPCARRLSIAQPVADGDAEPQPEPRVRRLSIAQPVADGDAEPEPEPCARRLSIAQPVADGDAEPQPEPCARRLSIAQPVADGDAEPEPEPCARRLSIAQPVAGGDAEPQPEPCARRLSIAQPVADGDAEPEPELRG
eukprot:tig00021579_g22430.t1